MNIAQIRANHDAITAEVEKLRAQMALELQLLGIGALVVRALIAHCEPSNADEDPAQATAWQAARNWLEGVDRHLPEKPT